MLTGETHHRVDTYPHAYLTVPEFAEYLMVTDRSVRKQIRAGVLTA